MSRKLRKTKTSTKMDPTSHLHTQGALISPGSWFSSDKWVLFLAFSYSQQLEILKSIPLKSGGDLCTTAIRHLPCFSIRQESATIVIYSIYIQYIRRVVDVKGSHCGWFFVRLSRRAFPLNYKHFFRIALHDC